MQKKIPIHSVLPSQAVSEWNEEHKQNKQFCVNLICMGVVIRTLTEYTHH